jgi:hypothetical protein
MMIVAGCADREPMEFDPSDRVASTPSNGSVTIPLVSDWTDRGVAILPSASGWDNRFPAGTPGTIIKIGGTYHMYYVGAGGDRPSDGGPAYRAVGLATSTDGIAWSKHPNNPIVPWSALNRNSDDEEGAWRLAAMLDADGSVLLYLTELYGSGGSVNGSIHLWTSSDGVSFTDQDEVVSFNDVDFPGNDELGVLGAARTDAGLCHVYYTAKGGAAGSWDYTETNASTCDGFTSGRTLLELSPDIRYGSNPIRNNETDWVLPIGTYSGHIRLYKTSDLSVLGTLVATYGDLPQAATSARGNFSLYLDRDVGTWFLLVATTSGSQGDDDWTAVRVLTAPVEQ